MADRNIQKIKEDIRKNREFLKNTYRVREVGIFGSVARGQKRKGSDIDILVDFSKPIGLFDFIRLERFLSQVLKKKVDLVFKKAIKPAIKKEILDEVIYV